MLVKQTKNVYSENVLTSWLCSIVCSMRGESLGMRLTSWLCDSIDLSCLCMFSEGPLITSYEAMIIVTTSDGFGSVSAFTFITF